MVNKIVYDLPRHTHHLIEILKSIPPTWDCLDGFLLAPFPLYNRGEIAQRTRLVIGADSNRRASIVGADDVPFEESKNPREPEDDLYEPDVLAVLLNKKGYSSIHFDHAGFFQPTLSGARDLAVSFIEMGYKGELTAYRNYEGISESEIIYSERFSFSHMTRTLDLAFDTAHLGREHNILRIQRAIELCGLHERQPNILPFKRAGSG